MEFSKRLTHSSSQQAYPLEHLPNQQASPEREQAAMRELWSTVKGDRRTVSGFF